MSHVSFSESGCLQMSTPGGAQHAEGQRSWLSRCMLVCAVPAISAVCW